MIDHIGFEVADLERSATFYDAVFFALGARRMFASDHALAYGVNGAHTSRSLLTGGISFLVKF